MLETALSLLDASAPLIEGSEAAAAGAISAEDRKIWLAAVARLAIRVVAVLEGAGVEIEEEQQQQLTAAAFEGRKPSPAQQLPLTLSALLAALDVRYAVFDRNRHERARHLCGLALARRSRGGRVERSQKKRSKEKRREQQKLSRPSLELPAPHPPLPHTKKPWAKKKEKEGDEPSRLKLASLAPDSRFFLFFPPSCFLTSHPLSTQHSPISASSPSSSSTLDPWEKKTTGSRAS